MTYSDIDTACQGLHVLHTFFWDLSAFRFNDIVSYLVASMAMVSPLRAGLEENASSTELLELRKRWAFEADVFPNWNYWFWNIFDSWVFHRLCVAFNAGEKIDWIFVCFINGHSLISSCTRKRPLLLRLLGERWVFCKGDLWFYTSYHSVLMNWTNAKGQLL